MATRTEVLDDLAWRGMIAQSTDLDALRAAMAAGPITFYCGFDPTAESLHFGHLMQLVTMRRLQLAGHRPIGLVGGATGLVGDPSGRSTERVLNEEEVVAAWVDRIRTQVERYLSFDGDNAAIIVNNLDWTAPLSTIAFLRDIGKHFSVARMLGKESVTARLDSGSISFTEFSYQVMQALDSLELYRRHGCTLQTGGSDQWGNLTAGVDLIRRAEGATAHALTTPLLTRPDGSKFSASEGGTTLWLDTGLTSPYAFYQYFVNVADSVVGAYLRAFSFRSRAEIEALEAEAAARPEARIAQRALADEVTTLVHGGDEARRAAAAAEALFGSGDLAALDEATLAAALSELPSVSVDGGPGSVTDLFVASGLAESRSAARRLVAEGGAYVNNRKVTEADALVASDQFLHRRWLVLRRGKRNLAVVALGN